MGNENKVARKASVGTIVCIVISVLLLPLFLINVTLVVKGLINDKEPPSIFGYTPLAVTSGSMDDGSKNCIQIGDLIFVKKADIDKLEVGDIITFEEKNGYVTHRIVEVVYVDETQEEVNYFLTKGDAPENDIDPWTVDPEEVHGKYVGRMGGLGKCILFLQTPWGIVLFVGIPVATYFAFELASKLSERRRKGSIEEKDAEIERLRAMLAQQSGTPAEEVVAEDGAEPQPTEEQPTEAQAEPLAEPVEETPADSEEKSE